jgi:hypothetical protein
VLHCQEHWADRRADSETKVWCSIASPDAWDESDAIDTHGVGSPGFRAAFMPCAAPMKKSKVFKYLDWV